jgi:hypothetical protein
MRNVRLTLFENYNIDIIQNKCYEYKYSHQKGEDMGFGFYDFINKIKDIEKQLGTLYSKSEKLTNEIINSMEWEDIEFVDKDILINKFENLLTSITHEVGTEIGFYKEDIIKLHKYIYFRIEYKKFSDEILEKIIDSGLTLEEKGEIFGEYNIKESVNIIKEIKHDWNESFGNINYKKLKKEIKLDKI